MSPHVPRRAGFTLVELLVVIAIIGVLVALLLPAVQAAREAARKTQCRNQLKQIGLGVQNYHDTYRSLPPGFSQVNVGNAGDHLGFGWGARLLPYMEQTALYDRLAPGLGATNPASFVTQVELKTWQCPTDNRIDGPASWANVTPGAATGGGQCVDSMGNVIAGMYTAATCPGTWQSQYGNNVTSNRPFAAKASYVGNYGPQSQTSVGPDGGGVFYANSFLNLAAITDGTSNTFLAGERYMQNGHAAWECTHFEESGSGGGWTPPTITQQQTGRFVLGSTAAGGPGNTSVYGFSSRHSGGCHMTLCDGSVRFISRSVNTQVWNNLGQRHDGQPISGEF